MTSKDSKSVRRTGSGTLRTASHTFALAWRADPAVVRVIIVLSLAQAGAVAATGVSQRWVVDATQNSGGRPLGALALAVLIGVAAHVTAAAGNRTRYNYQHDLTDRVDLEVNREILTATASIPTLEHLERPGYLNRLELLRRHTSALAGSCWALTDTGIAVMGAGLSLWLLIGVHPALAALALLALPSLWAVKFAERSLARARNTTAEDQRLENRIHRMVLAPESGKEIYLAGAGSVLDETAHVARTRVVTAVVKARLRATGWQLSGWVIYAAGFIAALILTVSLVAQGRASLGDLMLVITLGTQLRFQIHATTSGFSRIAEAGHATGHYLWLSAHARRRRSTGTCQIPSMLKRGIQMRDVSFTYPGSPVPVLSGVNLTLRPGSTVAVVGVNGAGKTTLVKLLSGMYAPTAGRVDIDGVPLGELDIEAWRRGLTGAFQDFVRFQLPVRHTVGIGEPDAMDSQEEVARAVREAGAEAIIARLPEGLDTQLGPVYGGTELSQGQWQRLALARALMRRRPRLLVLDEPTAALDPLAEHELYEAFMRQAKAAPGQITLLVSHRFSTVRGADHIVVLDGGRVTEEGTHTQLMAAGGRYAELYLTQAAAYEEEGDRGGGHAGSDAR
ncbi:ABC transporter ATP-binding protein [Streptomyces zingiberis]|uniref:ABC transporter ATP-binding protein n=1 Tax=Streptomyces zingiberis TaxID=2053010 RepID=A0ABX1BZG5_9ACTN|nr:ABC transporter ATP-binding protein [Streptomyces zingiberis]NJQ01087.1 ABC transporter ATP-binding protein [Streptomyces zingiberis]